MVSTDGSAHYGVFGKCVGADNHFSNLYPSHIRWLAGHTHKLAKHGWSVLSMSKALNIFEKAMEKIVNDGGFILSEDWVMHVFDDIADVSEICITITLSY